MKLYIASNQEKGANGGVVAVMNAHEKHLRALGVQYVNSEKRADLVIVHALALENKRTDVYHSHGFYPTAYEAWGERYDGVNKKLINYVMTARSVVAVSELAAEVMRRDLHVQPRIIRNGVDFKQVHLGGRATGWVLWPKINCNPTCDPEPLKWLANHTPYPVASMANVADNVKSFGVQPRKDFLSMLKNCSIYLGTTRENNPMAEMEAMASGLPVVGYDWGFNREWLTSGHGCELVEPGDLPGLAQAIEKVLINWRYYHEAAIEFANKNFGWEEPIQKVYDLYRSMLEPVPAPKVSVIIPLYNYANWVGEAVQSAKAAHPYEIIVVDDCSTDNPVIPPGVKLIRFDRNQGVAVARNTGIAQAKGDLIICLDADDRLTPTSISRLLPEFSDPRLGIAFAPLSLINETGQRSPHIWFEAPFDYGRQSTGGNTVPTCCMFRKTAWKRAGGFRGYEKPAEDAALWLRMTSQGWTAKNIEGKPMLDYRLHTGSQTQLNPVYDWWKENRAWSKRSSATGAPLQMYDCPKVSFVIDYRVRHELEFIVTLDSIEGLTAIDWEVCASGVPTPLVRSGYPFIRWNAEPTAAIVVLLEAGETVDDKTWQEYAKSVEFPL